MQLAEKKRKINWNTVIFKDCLNPINGLPTLPDKSIDICFTDPPFNVEFRGKEGYYENGNCEKQYYEDKVNHFSYKEWCREWLSELKRVCNTVLVHVGKVQLSMWYEIDPPYDIVFWYPSNSEPSTGKASWLIKLHPILCYGKFGKRRFKRDIFESVVNLTYRGKLIHPCPLGEFIIRTAISNLKPTSVIDPFMGSGTTAEICEEFGVRWLGYEKEKKYEKDIKLRLSNVKTSLQTNMDKYLE